MPTLPDAGRLGGGPHARAEEGTVRMAVRGQGHADPGVWEVLAVGRGDGFVVLAEVTARAAGELRLADGGPVWVTVEATGWPATGLNSIGPGLWARPAAWYHRSCPECDESSAWWWSRS